MKREIFLEEFWKCFRRLEDTADEMVGKAAYFRFLTLLGMSTRALASFKFPRINEVMSD